MRFVFDAASELRARKSILVSFFTLFVSNRTSMVSPLEALAKLVGCTSFHTKPFPGSIDTVNYIHLIIYM